MIKVIHEISKLGAVLWTILCLIITIFMFIGFGSANTDPTMTPEMDAAMTMGGVFGFILMGALWFFPTLCAIVAMYFTRPQAWATPPATQAAPPPVQES